MKMALRGVPNLRLPTSLSLIPTTRHVSPAFEEPHVSGLDSRRVSTTP